MADLNISMVFILATFTRPNVVPSITKFYDFVLYIKVLRHQSISNILYVIVERLIQGIVIGCYIASTLMIYSFVNDF